MGVGSDSAGPNCVLGLVTRIQQFLILFNIIIQHLIGPFFLEESISLDIFITRTKHYFFFYLEIFKCFYYYLTRDAMHVTCLVIL